VAGILALIALGHWVIGAEVSLLARLIGPQADQFWSQWPSGGPRYTRTFERLT
jgi:hypothetical protein